MLRYSERGLADWKRVAGSAMKTAAQECLANTIVEDDWDISHVIKGRKSSFIPMPQHGYNGFDWCFFSPRKVRGELRSFLLFVLVNWAARDCIAFRFESDSVGSHGYTHVQLTPKWTKSGDAFSGVPQWLPDSYPAFPIPAQNWTELFLVMATAVHGRHGGVDFLIRDLFASEQTADCAVRYNDMLTKRLVELDRDTDL